MQYRIVGNTMPAVEILFDQAGESMYTQSGGMVWQSDGIEMSTSTNGGIMKGVGRMFAGESMFMVRLICQAGVSLSDDRIFNSRERNVACCLCLIMLTENFAVYILVKVNSI